MTLISFLIVVSLVLLGLFVGSRLMPAYSGFGRVMSVMREVQNISGVETKDVHFIRAEIARRFEAGGITDVTAKDLKISRKRGGFEVEVRYEKRVSMLSTLGVIAKFERIVEVPKKPRSS